MAVQGAIFARGLATLVKRLAMARNEMFGLAVPGLTPDQIRRLTLQDLRRFYTKDVIMPKVRRRPEGK